MTGEYIGAIAMLPFVILMNVMKLYYIITQ